MEHMNEDDVVILTVLNRRTYLHDVPKKIKKTAGKDLIQRANNILYQDNDYFGIFSLYGVKKEPDIIHNILFPQLE